MDHINNLEFDHDNSDHILEPGTTGRILSPGLS